MDFFFRPELRPTRSIHVTIDHTDLPFIIFELPGTTDSGPGGSFTQFVATLCIDSKI
jgi:hypothetical protein